MASWSEGVNVKEEGAEVKQEFEVKRELPDDFDQAAVKEETAITEEWECQVKFEPVEPEDGSQDGGDCRPGSSSGHVLAAVTPEKGVRYVSWEVVDQSQLGQASETGTRTLSPWISTSHGGGKSGGHQCDITPPSVPMPSQRGWCEHEMVKMEPVEEMEIKTEVEDGGFGAVSDEHDVSGLKISSVVSGEEQVQAVTEELAWPGPARRTGKRKMGVEAASESQPGWKKNGSPSQPGKKKHSPCGQDLTEQRPSGSLEEERSGGGKPHPDRTHSLQLSQAVAKSAGDDLPHTARTNSLRFQIGKLLVPAVVSSDGRKTDLKTVTSESLLYPHCHCKVPDGEGGPREKGLEHVGVVWLMQQRILTFSSEGNLFMFLMEYHLNNLLPRLALVDHVLLGLTIAQREEVRNCTTEEWKFMSRLYRDWETTLNTSIMVTPLIMHLIYTNAEKHDQQDRWRRYARTMFYRQQYGHVCPWTTLITPLAARDNLPDFSSMVDQRPAKGSHVPRILARLKKRSAQQPERQLSKENSANIVSQALDQLLASFGLKGLVEPFCTCRLTLSDLMTRFEVDGACHFQVMRMSFMGSRSLYCWLRPTGIFVSVQELKVLGLLPWKQLMVEDMLLAGRQDRDRANLTYRETCFLRPVASSMTGEICTPLVGLKYLRLIYRCLANFDSLWAPFPAAKFYLKLCDHRCPAAKVNEDAGHQARPFVLPPGSMPSQRWPSERDKVKQFVPTSTQSGTFTGQLGRTSGQSLPKGVGSLGGSSSPTPTSARCIPILSRTRAGGHSSSHASDSDATSPSKSDSSKKMPNEVLRKSTKHRKKEDPLILGSTAGLSTDANLTEATEGAPDSVALMKAVAKDCDPAGGSASLPGPAEGDAKKSPAQSNQALSQCFSSIVIEPRRSEPTKRAAPYRLADFPRACTCVGKTTVFPYFSVLACAPTARACEVMPINRLMGQAIIRRPLSLLALYTFTADDTLFFSVGELTVRGILRHDLDLDTIPSYGPPGWLRPGEDFEVRCLRARKVHLKSNTFSQYVVSAELLCHLTSLPVASDFGAVKQADIHLLSLGHVCEDTASLAFKMQRRVRHPLGIQDVDITRAWAWEEASTDVMNPCPVVWPGGQQDQARKKAETGAGISSPPPDSHLETLTHDSPANTATRVETYKRTCAATQTASPSLREKTEKCERLTVLGPKDTGPDDCTEGSSRQRESQCDSSHACTRAGKDKRLQIALRVLKSVAVGRINVKAIRAALADYFVGEEGDSLPGLIVKVEQRAEKERVADGEEPLAVLQTAGVTDPEAVAKLLPMYEGKFVLKHLDPSGCAPVSSMPRAEAQPVCLELLRSSLGDRASDYWIVLTGTLDYNGECFSTMFVDNRLYINWAEFVDKSLFSSDLVYQLACVLCIYVYRPPPAVRQHMLKFQPKHHYDGPWITVKSLRAIYYLGFENPQFKNYPKTFAHLHARFIQRRPVGKFSDFILIKKQLAPK